MRILICVGAFEPSLVYGGQAAVASDHAFGLARRGHEVTVLTSNLASLRGATTHDARFLERDGVQIHYLPARVLYPHFSAVHVDGLRRWLDQNLDRFDVAHVHFPREYLAVTCASVLRRAAKPHVLQTHGTLHNRRLPHRVFDALFVRKALRGASAVLYLQEQEAQQLRAIEPRARLEQLLNGVALPDGPPTWNPSRLASDPLITFIGTLAPVKRALDLIEAAHLLERQGIRARYEIIGPDGGDLAAAQARTRELGLSDRVRLVGALPRSEAMRRLSEAAIYVQPSAWESFSLTTFEAMARGVPCLVTSASEFASRLQAARAALVVEPGPRSVADGIRRLLEDPREAADLAARGHAWMTENYALNAVVDRLIAIYDGLVRS